MKPSASVACLAMVVLIVAGCGKNVSEKKFNDALKAQGELNTEFQNDLSAVKADTTQIKSSVDAIEEMMRNGGAGGAGSNQRPQYQPPPNSIRFNVDGWDVALQPGYAPDPNANFWQQIGGYLGVQPSGSPPQHVSRAQLEQLCRVVHCLTKEEQPGCTPQQVEEALKQLKELADQDKQILEKLEQLEKNFQTQLHEQTRRKIREEHQQPPALIIPAPAGPIFPEPIPSSATSSYRWREQFEHGGGYVWPTSYWDHYRRPSVGRLLFESSQRANPRINRTAFGKIHY